jgi:hypothetical protein
VIASTNFIPRFSNGENMTVRLVWENGATTDMEIGKGTVAAWKTVFKPSAQAGTNQPLAPSP